MVTDPISIGYEPPRGPIETTLAEIWSSTLHVARVGRHDNFFELGGQSLVAMDVLSKVAERVGVEPPLVTLFLRPTVSELAESVVTLLSEQSTRTTLQAAQSRPNELPPRLIRAPLAFSQLAHWRLYGLQNRRSVRQVAQASRLQGCVRIDALREAVAEVVRRHDALRTRVVLAEGVPQQEVNPPGDFEIQLVDLTCVGESRCEIELLQQIEAAILQPINVSRDSLLCVWLWQVKPDEHVILVAMEHMISDMASMDVFLREVFTAYGQILCEESLSLPPVPLQFSDYALRQKSSHPQWLLRHGAYWQERLRDCPRQRFPSGERCSAVNFTSWASTPVRIEPSLKRRLREWCRLERTSLPIALFTAYVALVLRWCDVSETVVRYQGIGRDGRQTEHCIGFFASRLYLRLSIQPRDRFRDLMHQLTQEYCKAYEHDDFAYLETMTPAPACDRNTFFNYIPLGPSIDLSALRGSAHEVLLQPFSFANPWVNQLTWDNEPMTMLFEAEDEINGAVYYAAERLSAGVMEHFARNYLAFVERLLEQPDARVSETPIA